MEVRNMFRRGGKVYIDVVPRMITHEMIDRGYFEDTQAVISLEKLLALEDLDLRTNVARGFTLTNLLLTVSIVALITTIVLFAMVK